MDINKDRADEIEWRQSFEPYLDNTGNNINLLRNDRRPNKHLESTHAPKVQSILYPETAIHSAKSELGSLLAAVQGSLADLRVEVSEARRLRSNTPVHSYGALAPSYSQPTPGSYKSPERMYEMQSANSNAFQSHYLPVAAPPFSRGIMQNTGYTSALDQPASDYEVMKHIDKKVDELTRKLETIDNARGNTAAVNEPLIMRGVNKAETAEKLATELRMELTILGKQIERGVQDTDKRLSSVNEEVRQHWEKICKLTSQLDALSSHRTESNLDIRKLEVKLHQVESNADRAVSVADEQQRHVTELVTSMLKLQQLVEKLEGRHATLSTTIQQQHQQQPDFSRSSGDTMHRMGSIEKKLEDLGLLVSKVVARQEQQTTAAAKTGVDLSVVQSSTQSLEMQMRLLESWMAAAQLKPAAEQELQATQGRLEKLEKQMGEVMLTVQHNGLGLLHDVNGSVGSRPASASNGGYFDPSRVPGSAAKSVPGQRPSFGPPPLVGLSNQVSSLREDMDQLRQVVMDQARQVAAASEVSQAALNTDPLARSAALRTFEERLAGMEAELRNARDKEQRDLRACVTSIEELTRQSAANQKQLTDELALRQMQMPQMGERLAVVETRMEERQALDARVAEVEATAAQLQHALGAVEKTLVNVSALGAVVQEDVEKLPVLEDSQRKLQSLVQALERQLNSLANTSAQVELRLVDMEALKLDELGVTLQQQMGAAEVKMEGLQKTSRSLAQGVEKVEKRLAELETDSLRTQELEATVSALLKTVEPLQDLPAKHEAVHEATRDLGDRLSAAVESVSTRLSEEDQQAILEQVQHKVDAGLAAVTSKTTAICEGVCAQREKELLQQVHTEVELASDRLKEEITSEIAAAIQKQQELLPDLLNPQIMAACSVVKDQLTAEIKSVSDLCVSSAEVQSQIETSCAVVERRLATEMESIRDLIPAQDERESLLEELQYEIEASCTALESRLDAEIRSVRELSQSTNKQGSQEPLLETLRSEIQAACDGLESRLAAEIRLVREQELPAKHEAHEAQLQDLRSEIEVSCAAVESRLAAEIRLVREQDLPAKHEAHEAQLQNLRSEIEASCAAVESRLAAEIRLVREQDLPAKHEAYEAQFQDLRSKIEASCAAVESRLAAEIRSIHESDLPEKHEAALKSFQSRIEGPCAVVEKWMESNANDGPDAPSKTQQMQEQVDAKLAEASLRSDQQISDLRQQLEAAVAAAENRVQSDLNGLTLELSSSFARLESQVEDSVSNQEAFQSRVEPKVEELSKGLAEVSGAPGGLEKSVEKAASLESEVRALVEKMEESQRTWAAEIAAVKASLSGEMELLKAGTAASSEILRSELDNDLAQIRGLLDAKTAVDPELLDQAESISLLESHIAELARKTDERFRESKGEVEDKVNGVLDVLEDLKKVLESRVNEVPEVLEQRLRSISVKSQDVDGFTELQSRVNKLSEKLTEDIPVAIAEIQAQVKVINESKDALKALLESKLADVPVVIEEKVKAAVARSEEELMRSVLGQCEGTPAGIASQVKALEQAVGQPAADLSLSAAVGVLQIQISDQVLPRLLELEEAKAAELAMEAGKTADNWEAEDARVRKLVEQHVSLQAEALTSALQKLEGMRMAKHEAQDQEIEEIKKKLAEVADSVGESYDTVVVRMMSEIGSSEARVLSLTASIDGLRALSERVQELCLEHREAIKSLRDRMNVSKGELMDRRDEDAQTAKDASGSGNLTKGGPVELQAADAKVAATTDDGEESFSNNDSTLELLLGEIGSISSRVKLLELHVLKGQDGRFLQNPSFRFSVEEDEQQSERERRFMTNPAYRFTGENDGELSGNDSPTSSEYEASGPRDYDRLARDEAMAPVHSESALEAHRKLREKAAYLDVLAQNSRSPVSSPSPSGRYSSNPPYGAAVTSLAAAGLDEPASPEVQSPSGLGDCMSPIYNKPGHIQGLMLTVPNAEDVTPMSEYVGSPATWEAASQLMASVVTSTLFGDPDSPLSSPATSFRSSSGAPLPVPRRKSWSRTSESPTSSPLSRLVDDELAAGTSPLFKGDGSSTRSVSPVFSGAEDEDRNVRYEKNIPLPRVLPDLPEPSEPVAFAALNLAEKPEGISIGGGTEIESTLVKPSSASSISPPKSEAGAIVSKSIDATSEPLDAFAKLSSEMNAYVPIDNGLQASFINQELADSWSKLGEPEALPSRLSVMVPAESNPLSNKSSPLPTPTGLPPRSPREFGSGRLSPASRQLSPSPSGCAIVDLLPGGAYSMDEHSGSESDDESMPTDKSNPTGSGLQSDPRGTTPNLWDLDVPGSSLDLEDIALNGASFKLDEGLKDEYSLSFEADLEFEKGSVGKPSNNRVNNKEMKATATVSEHVQVPVTPERDASSKPADLFMTSSPIVGLLSDVVEGVKEAARAAAATAEDESLYKLDSLEAESVSTQGSLSQSVGSVHVSASTSLAPSASASNQLPNTTSLPLESAGGLQSLTVSASASAPSSLIASPDLATEATEISLQELTMRSIPSTTQSESASLTRDPSVNLNIPTVSFPVDKVKDTQSAGSANTAIPKTSSELPKSSEQLNVNQPSKIPAAPAVSISETTPASPNQSTTTPIGRAKPADLTIEVPAPSIISSTGTPTSAAAELKTAAVAAASPKPAVTKTPASPTPAKTPAAAAKTPASPVAAKTATTTAAVKSPTVATAAAAKTAAPAAAATKTPASPTTAAKTTAVAKTTGVASPTAKAPATAGAVAATPASPVASTESASGNDATTTSKATAGTPTVAAVSTGATPSTPSSPAPATAAVATGATPASPSGSTPASAAKSVGAASPTGTTPTKAATVAATDSAAKTTAGATPAAATKTPASPTGAKTPASPTTLTKSASTPATKAASSPAATKAVAAKPVVAAAGAVTATTPASPKPVAAATTASAAKPAANTVAAKTASTSGPPSPAAAKSTAASTSPSADVPAAESLQSVASVPAPPSPSTAAAPKLATAASAPVATKTATAPVQAKPASTTGGPASPSPAKTTSTSTSPASKSPTTSTSGSTAKPATSSTSATTKPTTAASGSSTTATSSATAAAKTPTTTPAKTPASPTASGPSSPVPTKPAVSGKAVAASATTSSASASSAAPAVSSKIPQPAAVSTSSPVVSIEPSLESANNAASGTESQVQLPTASAAEATSITKKQAGTGKATAEASEPPVTQVSTTVSEAKVQDPPQPIKLVNPVLDNAISSSPTLNDAEELTRNVIGTTTSKSIAEPTVMSSTSVAEQSLSQEAVDPPASTQPPPASLAPARSFAVQARYTNSRGPGFGDEEMELSSEEEEDIAGTKVAEEVPSVLSKDIRSLSSEGANTSGVGVSKEVGNLSPPAASLTQTTAESSENSGPLAEVTYSKSPSMRDALRQLQQRQSESGSEGNTALHDSFLKRLQEANISLRSTESAVLPTGESTAGGSPRTESGLDMESISTAAPSGRVTDSGNNTIGEASSSLAAEDGSKLIAKLSVPLTRRLLEPLTERVITGSLDFEDDEESSSDSSDRSQPTRSDFRSSTPGYPSANYPSSGQPELALEDSGELEVFIKADPTPSTGARARGQSQSTELGSSQGAAAKPSSIFSGTVTNDQPVSPADAYTPTGNPTPKPTLQEWEEDELGDIYPSDPLPDFASQRGNKPGPLRTGLAAMGDESFDVESEPSSPLEPPQEGHTSRSAAGGIPGVSKLSSSSPPYGTAARGTTFDDEELYSPNAWPPAPPNMADESYALSSDSEPLDIQPRISLGNHTPDDSIDDYELSDELIGIPRRYDLHDPDDSMPLEAHEAHDLRSMSSLMEESYDSYGLSDLPYSPTGPGGPIGESTEPTPEKPEVSALLDLSIHLASTFEPQIPQPQFGSGRIEHAPSPPSYPMPSNRPQRNKPVSDILGELSFESVSALDLSGSSSRVWVPPRRCGSVDDPDEMNSSFDGSEASLSMFAPDGIKPPSTSADVRYDGTMRKRVSFSEMHEHHSFERHSDSDSVESLTEEQLLEAQGELPEYSYSLGTAEHDLSYEDLMGPPGPSSGQGASVKGVTPIAVPTLASMLPQSPSLRGLSSSPHLNKQASIDSPHNNIKLVVATGDKTGAGLPSGGVVHVEILGTEYIISHSLPREPQTFQRGCIDRFAIQCSESRSLGTIVAMKVWHDVPASHSSSGVAASWNLERVELDVRASGQSFRYVFDNASNKDGWIRRGRKQAVILKPRVESATESFFKSQSFNERSLNSSMSEKDGSGPSQSRNPSMGARIGALAARARIAMAGVGRSLTGSGRPTSPALSTGSRE